jgi:hypothetical protein
MPSADKMSPRGSFRATAITRGLSLAVDKAWAFTIWMLFSCTNRATKHSNMAMPTQRIRRSIRGLPSWWW